ncbi:transposase [Galbibacter sp.]|uniref:transposase n=1 Tax=Galbibacter sp. TaxID=2918471 RepID=UPI003A941FBE
MNVPNYPSILLQIADIFHPIFHQTQLISQSLSISQIVRRLKQQSTKLIWQKHPVSLQKQCWRKCTFWSEGYFVCVIGEASPDTIPQYILPQG